MPDSSQKSLYAKLVAYQADICLCHSPYRIWDKVKRPEVQIIVVVEEGELCWSSAHLVQCGPDELNWTWTKIWVGTWMPDYRLNLTARFSVIHRCQIMQPAHPKVAQPSLGAFWSRVWHWTLSIRHGFLTGCKLPLFPKYIKVCKF